jgi:surface antigen
LGCTPVLLIGFVFLTILSLVLGGTASVNTSANAPAGISNDQLTTAKAIVARIKQEIPKATPTGIAGLLGCFQAESGVNPKRAEGDYLVYPIGAAGATDAQTYNNTAWSSLGGSAIYGRPSPIQQRGLGLGQYTNGRNLALQAYAKSVGKPWYDLNTQLDYILSVDSSKDLLKTLVTESADVTQNTTDFVQQYERGGSSGLALRIAYAQAWANWLTNPASTGSSAKGTITSLNGLIGQQVGDGQCYALSSWYVQKISGFILQGMSASAIGSDNAAAFAKAGWKVIPNPKASDLKVGAVVCWATGPVSNSPYGHTAIVNSVSGNQFTTYDQNVGGNQTVQLYSRSWDSSMTYVILPPNK